MKEADPTSPGPKGDDAMSSNAYPDGNEPECYSGDGPWRNSPEPKRVPQIGGYHSIMGEALIAPSPATSPGRTDAQIVEQTNELARRVLRFQGYEAPKDFRFDSAPPENIRANRAWKFAAEIQEFMTATDVENALANMDEASTAPHSPDASGLVRAAEAYEHASEMATMKAADLEIHKTQQFGITALSNLASELLDEAHALRSRADNARLLGNVIASDGRRIVSAGSD